MAVAERPLRSGDLLERLGVDRKTLNRIPASELPYFRVGARGDRRYLPGDVDAYIERRRGQ